jgi:uncharacterized membrane protein YphA (DoxX/SURF4 family)
MRLAVAFGAIVQSIGTLTRSQELVDWAIGLFGILLGIALLAGFLTPIAGALASLGNLAIWGFWLFAIDVNAHDKALAAFYSFVISIAITLLGPGAISLDARLFGRREIIIPESRTRLP